MSTCLFDQSHAMEQIAALLPTSGREAMKQQLVSGTTMYNPNVAAMLDASEADPEGMAALEYGYERKGFGRALKNEWLVLPFALYMGDYSCSTENYYKTLPGTLDATEAAPKDDFLKQWGDDHLALFCKDGPAYKNGKIELPSDATEADALKARIARAYNRLTGEKVKEGTALDATEFKWEDFRKKHWVQKSTAAGNDADYKFAVFHDPSTGKEFCTAALVGSGQENKENYAYSYVFPMDQHVIKKNRAHPLSLQNLSVDALHKYFIAPLRKKYGSSEGCHETEREALRAYWRYYSLLYSGSGNRAVPDTSAFTGAGLDNTKKKFNDLYLTKYDGEYGEKDGRRFGDEGLFNIFRRTLKYEKVRAVMKRFSMEQRVAYLYFCAWSLTKLFKMITAAELKPKERKAWRDYIRAKIDVLLHYLDDKRNWPRSEQVTANKKGMGPYLMAIWLDIYAAIKWVQQALTREKKVIDFVAQAPPEQLLQTLNENRQAYKDWLAKTGADVANPMVLLQKCTNKGLEVRFWTTDGKPIEGGLVTDASGNRTLSKEVERLRARGKLHVECEGLLAVFEHEFGKEGEITAAIIPRPSGFIDPARVKEMLKVGLPAATPFVRDGQQLFALPMDWFRSEMKRQSIDGSDGYGEMLSEDNHGEFSGTDDSDDESSEEESSSSSDDDGWMKEVVGAPDRNYVRGQTAKRLFSKGAHDADVDPSEDSSDDDYNNTTAHPDQLKDLQSHTGHPARAFPMSGKKWKSVKRYGQKVIRLHTKRL